MFICALVFAVVNEIPVVFEQFKKQLFKLTIEAADPETVKRANEFVCNCIPEIVTEPALEKVQFPFIITCPVLFNDESH